jgi:hypothetical protein
MCSFSLARLKPTILLTVGLCSRPLKQVGTVQANYLKNQFLRPLDVAKRTAALGNPRVVTSKYACIPSIRWAGPKSPNFWSPASRPYGSEWPQITFYPLFFRPPHFAELVASLVCSNYCCTSSPEDRLLDESGNQPNYFCHRSARIPVYLV